MKPSISLAGCHATLFSKDGDGEGSVVADTENESRHGDGIDLERVVVDPDYRRRVLALLRAEAALDPPHQPETLPVALSET
jgi:GNAT superfamily N-acetyltransferase